MNQSICLFVPQKEGAALETFHFVYETEFRKLKQPFKRPTYCAYLVTAGRADLKMQTDQHTITENTRFFTFPSVPFEILSHDRLEYIYISFSGSGIDLQLQALGVTPDQFVFHKMDKVTALWKDTIRRIDKQNITILTECAMLYALSFLNTAAKEASDAAEETPFSKILSYINNNFTDPDLTVRKVAALFSYSEKYLSQLFKKTMGVTFTNYLNKIRIQHGLFLIENGEISVSKISAACGFSDPLYFSKVFRSQVQLSPKEKIKASTPKNKI